jgi:hypothetical protein
LYNLKREEENIAYKEELEEIVSDYKLGMMDPSREAAKTEK